MAARGIVNKLDSLEKNLKSFAIREQQLCESKASYINQIAIGKIIIQALLNQQQEVKDFEKIITDYLKDFDVDCHLESCFSIKIDTNPIQTIINNKQKEINLIDNELFHDELFSLKKLNADIHIEINGLKHKLSDKQKQAVEFREALSQWEKDIAALIGSEDVIGSISWIKNELNFLKELPDSLTSLQADRLAIVKEIHCYITEMVKEYEYLYSPVQKFVESTGQMKMNFPLEFQVCIEESNFKMKLFSMLDRVRKGSFCGIEESDQTLSKLLRETSFDSTDEVLKFVELINKMLHHDYRNGLDNLVAVKLSDQLRKESQATDILNYIYSLEYLKPQYFLSYKGQFIDQLSPGERGLLLLVFYLLVDKNDIPIIIDQPEENLDNQTIFDTLVKCIKKAKEFRQVIIVTHNPNLAVVCDAEQIIYASCDKKDSRFSYESGAIEDDKIKEKIVQILEGTEPAFKNRQSKYRL